MVSDEEMIFLCTFRFGKLEQIRYNNVTMRFIRNFRYVAMILLLSACGVKFASAAEYETDLTLDNGFIGRPVSLDLFSNAVSVGWNAESLVGQTRLRIRMTQSGGVEIESDGDRAFASGTRWHISIASTIQKAPAFRVTDSSGSMAVYRAAYSKGIVSGTIPCGSAVSIEVIEDPNADALLPDDGSVPVSETEKSISLTLDSGFVGRAASFDLFGGDVTLSWDAKTIVKPTGVTVISTKGGTWNEQESSADGIRVRFDDPTAVSSAGVFKIRHRALRPPNNKERPDVNIISSVTSTRSAVFSGTSIVYSVPAMADAVFSPVYCRGIMRTGMASWYAYKRCLCAASPDVPKGTLLKVSRQDDPSVSVIVKVNDFGPDRKRHPERVIDLDKVAFAKIGNPRGGVLAVTVERVDESTFGGQ